MKKKLIFLLALFLLAFMSFISASEIQDLSLQRNRIELLDGDANADQIVGIMDLANIGYNFGLTEGDTDWNWKTDIAGTNKKIDISDLAEVGINYGKSYKLLIDDPVFISPPEKNITREQVFSVYVNISTPSNVYALDFILKFNSSLLEIINITGGDFLSKDGANVFTVIRINKTLGELNFASTRIGTSTDVTGDGSLAKITFKALNKTGSSLLNIEQLTVIDSFLNEVHNVEIINGLVNVMDELVPIKTFVKKGVFIFSLPRNQQKTFNQLIVENLTNCNVVFEGGRYSLAYYAPSDANISNDNYVFLGLDNNLYPGQGYFVKVAGDCYIEMIGKTVEIEDLGFLGTKQLRTGWNLLGSSSFLTKFRPGNCQLFGDVGILKYGYNVTSCNEISGFTGGYEYCTVESGISRCRCQVNNFEPGLGYWIRTKNDCTLG